MNQRRIGTKANPIIGCLPPPGYQWQIVGRWPLGRRWDTWLQMYQDIAEDRPLGPGEPETTQTADDNANIPVRDA